MSRYMAVAVIKEKEADLKLEAAKSGDIQTLLKNKKFNDLVNDPRIQETVKKLKQKE